MKIGIQTCGSAGDMYPLFALAEGLCNAGHEVTLYYTSFFGQNFLPKTVSGLICLPTSIFEPGFDYTVPSRPIFALSLEAQMKYLMDEIIQPYQFQMAQAAEKLCQENSIVIGVGMLYQIICMAEKYQVPFISYQVDNVYVPAEGNAHIWLDDWIEKNWAEIVNTYRSEHGLLEVNNLRRNFYPSKILNLLGFSSSLQPSQDYWGETFEVCGYFNSNNAEYSLSEDLQNFLDAGSAPLFISLGSMTFYETDMQGMHELLVKAVELAGCRAIIQVGSTQISPALLNENIFQIGHIPHDVLLPLCFGMVHHGGSGTVHAALKYACPSITIGYAFDQFFWGQKLVDKGVSPSLLSRQLFDEVQLAGDIRKLMRYPRYKEMAQFVRLKIKRENGVKKAVRLIENIISRQMEYIL